jgi:hypothetical protein
MIFKQNPLTDLMRIRIRTVGKHVLVVLGKKMVLKDKKRGSARDRTGDLLGVNEMP